MREENYYEKKIEVCKETRDFAKRKIEHLDIQMIKLQERFDHDKRVYDDQTKHMQNIIKDMEKRIPELEKKLSQGFTTIDLKTGKEYKSFKDRHMGQLQEKIDWAKSNREQIEARYAQRQALRGKKRLNEEEKQIVKAEEIRESLQPAEELKTAYDSEIERLKEKEAFYKSEYEKLKEEAKAKPPIPITEEEIKKDQITIMKEVKDTVNNKMKELEPNKAKCPECGEYFTKGGAFVNHYNSHFNGHEELEE